MDINYICEFSVLAETCSYMEAADQLFISQSALSRHIKSLEEELGVQLFDRSTWKVSLSRYGAVFLPFARQIAATRYEYETALAAAQNACHGNIRIGTIPVMSHYQITDLLAEFQKNNVGFTLDVVLTTRRAANMLDLVRKGMGIALLSRRPTIPLMTDDIAAIDIEPRIITNINLAYPKNHQLSEGVKQFIRLVNISKK